MIITSVLQLGPMRLHENLRPLVGTPAFMSQTTNVHVLDHHRPCIEPLRPSLDPFVLSVKLNTVDSTSFLMTDPSFDERNRIGTPVDFPRGYFKSLMMTHQHKNCPSLSLVISFRMCWTLLDVGSPEIIILPNSIIIDSINSNGFGIFSYVMLAESVVKNACV